MDKVKVLIVDDSAFMRKILSDILNKDRRIVVVATARNGKDGLEKAKELQPDVITLDIEMPVMNGLQALERIMAEIPSPVVMVSSLTKEGADSTIQAITLGAVDFIQKPSGAISLDMEKVETQVIRKVIGASKATVKPMKPVPEKTPRRDILSKHKDLSRRNIVAIGTSTGGPRALQQLITELPEDIPAPIVIVQHMPPGFTRSLADRLDKLAAIHVKEAEQHEILNKGTAYIAPGGLHMKVIQSNGELYVELEETEAINGHRPSVNHLFTSLSYISDLRTISVVMTGMGADGTEGLLTLKSRCRHTYSIAEAQESCVVFGMPKAVIKSGLADEVSPLATLSRTIIKALG